MKRILNIKKIEEDLIVVRLEATKRRRIWLKLRKEDSDYCCSESCSLYRNCHNFPSPLKKYPNFGEFCNRLFNEYPDLASQLTTEYGVTSINQTVPIKKRR